MVHQENFVQDFILLFIQDLGDLHNKWSTFRTEKFEPWLNANAKPDELNESFITSLDRSEKQFLQTLALLQIHYELVDDREPLRAEADSVTLTPEENDRRASNALTRELDQNRLKHMCQHHSAVDALGRFVTGGLMYFTRLPNYETRFEYFKTCFNYLRTNLRILLRYNLVEKMPVARLLTYPDHTVYMLTEIKYRIEGNLLLESLYTPVEKLLENHAQPPIAKVCWPGDRKPFVEPKSTFKTIFSTEILMTDRLETKLTEVTDLNRSNEIFEGQPPNCYFILSKDLLLQLSRKLRESLPTNSSCPQIDHRFDNIVHYNRRKYYIINHWLKSIPGERRGRCEVPVFGAMFYKNWFSSDFDEKVTAWLEGNLFQGPSPQLRGPFNPSTWQDSSLEEDYAERFLGSCRLAEFRRLRDNIREYINLDKPTDEQTDQILENWEDVFWRYPLNHPPVSSGYWDKRRPTESELSRLKENWRNTFNEDEQYWTVISQSY